MKTNTLLKILLSLAFSSLISLNALAENEKAKLVIMGSTDVHGRIFPYDYYTGKEDNKGLAKIYTKVKEIRASNKNTLLVDSGDLLQGTPLTSYFGSVEKDKINPMVKAFNFMKYDAFSVGNHEYDYGLDSIYKASKDAKFPFLSTNTFFYKDKKGPFPSFVIKNVNGIKVGIIGFTTPGVSVWSKGIVENKLEFRDIVATAKDVVPELKKMVDVVLLIPHTGLHDQKGLEGYNSAETGTPPENVGKQLAQTLPDIDVLLLGHTHTEIKEMFENGVLISQADKFGNRLSIAELDLEKQNGKWKIVSKKSDTIDVTTLTPDPELMEHMKEEHEKTINYVNKEIASTDSDWSAQDSRMKDSPLVDLINKVQMETTGADLSSSALFNESVSIKKGKVTLANIASLYIYENTLYSIKITGKQLKDYLEYSVKFYDYVDGKVTVNKSVPGYNYDMVSGVDYKIDVSKPIGERIIDLTYKGNKVTDNMSFTMALNNYRQSGGGGFDMLKGSPVVYNKFQSIRDLIIEYISKKGTISPNEVFVKNWEVINK
jgi:2',3'-cyclic-nucleotide 2'-phosphodiesterase (5'-nucleotidase family)